MSSPIEPLPPAIAALLEKEARAHADVESMKNAVLAHVELASASTGTPGSDGGGGLSPARVGTATAAGLGARAVAAVGAATFLAGLLLGGIAGRVTSPPAESVAVSVATVAAAEPAPPPPEASRPQMLVPNPSEGAPERTGSSPIAKSNAPATVAAAAAKIESDMATDLIRERELVDAAQSALAHHRPNDALVAVERHARAFPKGQLVEERESLRLRALVAAGRGKEAEQRVPAFRNRYPKSVFAPAIDAALAKVTSARDGGAEGRGE